jgi:hypothetical protein
MSNILLYMMPYVNNELFMIHYIICNSLLIQSNI